MALANASLLGIGYLLLGRRALAAGCAGTSVVLVVIVGTAERAGWLQIVLLVWWAAVILHGLYLASRTRGPAEQVRAHRFVAAAVAVPVVATFALVRLDAGEKADDAEAAHLAGECDRVISIVDGVGFWQRVGDAPAADALLDSAAACGLVERARRLAGQDREAAAATIARYEDLPAARWDGARRYRADLLLDQAGVELHAALGGDEVALRSGFELLTRVREEIPERRDDVAGVLDDFLDRLATEDGCVTAETVDWVNGRNTRTAELDRAAEVVPEIAPAAYVRCADHLMAARDPAGARARYQQLTKEYPSDPLAPRAKRGVTVATHAVQLVDVRTRLRTSAANQQPAYCKRPAPYGAAKPYRGPGPHRALVYGQDFQRNSLPRGWRATDAANAVLVVCAGESRFGDAVRTCQYSPTGAPIGVVDVTFHKRKIPVRVIEVRTGRVVANTSVQINGASCPNRVEYTSYGPLDRGPSSQYVSSSTMDIRNAYQSLIRP